MPPLQVKAGEIDIRAALDALVLGWPEVTPGRMFGSQAYRARGVLFAMIGGQGLILTKLLPAQRQVAAAEHGAHVCVGHGKEIPAWTEFPLAGAAGIAAAASLVRCAYENAKAEAPGA